MKAFWWMHYLSMKLESILVDALFVKAFWWMNLCAFDVILSSRLFTKAKLFYFYKAYFIFTFWFLLSPKSDAQIFFFL